MSSNSFFWYSSAQYDGFFFFHYFFALPLFILLFYFSRAYFSFFDLNDKNSQQTQNLWKSFNQKGILLEFSSFVRALHDSSYDNIAVIITFLSRWRVWADYWNYIGTTWSDKAWSRDCDVSHVEISLHRWPRPVVAGMCIFFLCKFFRSHSRKCGHCVIWLLEQSLLGQQLSRWKISLLNLESLPCTSRSLTILISSTLLFIFLQSSNIRYLSKFLQYTSTYFFSFWKNTSC